MNKHLKMSKDWYLSEVDSLATDFPNEVRFAFNLPSTTSHEAVLAFAEREYETENPEYLDLFESEFESSWKPYTT